MADPVQGKNAVIYILRVDLSAYVPFACADEIQFDLEAEMLATTTQASGIFETFTYGGTKTWTAAIRGLLFLRDIITNKWFTFDALAAQINNTVVGIQVKFTDDGGFIRYMTGNVIIPHTSISKVTGQHARSVIDMQGTGAIAFDSSPVTSIGMALRIPNDADKTYIAVGGETYFEDAAAANKSVLVVSREGWDGFSIITSGTPDHRQVKYDAALGRFYFDPVNPFAAGEQLYAVVT